MKERIHLEPLMPPAASNEAEEGATTEVGATETEVEAAREVAATVKVAEERQRAAAVSKAEAVEVEAAVKVAEAVEAVEVAEAITTAEAVVEQCTDTAALDRELEALSRNQVFLNAFASQEKLTTQQVYEALQRFRQECILQNKLHHKGKKDLQAHFISWYRLTLKIRNYGSKNNQYVSPNERRRVDQQQRFAGYAAALAKYS